MWMNRYEIEEAVHRYARHEVLGPATRFLYRLMEETDNNSDGWCHWPAPGRAAAKLQELIQSPSTATIAKFHASLRPIKSFYTRRGNAAGMKFPEVS